MRLDCGLQAIFTDVSQNEIIYANAVFFSHVANEPVERDPCWASFDEAVRYTQACTPGSLLGFPDLHSLLPVPAVERVMLPLA